MQNGSLKSRRLKLLILGDVASLSLRMGLQSRSRCWPLRIWARFQGAVDSPPQQLYTGAMFHCAVRTCLVVILSILAAGRSFAAGTETWTEVRSPDFLVLTDANEKQGRHVALQFELIRAVFRQFFNLPSGAKGPVVTIAAVKDKDGLKRLMPERGSSPSGGIYVDGPDRSYIALQLDQISAQEAWEALGRRPDVPFEDVYHGYVHFLMRRVVPEMPLWLMEGLAEFFGSTKVERHQIVVGAPSRTNLEVLQRTKLLPLSTLFAVDTSSPYYHEEKRSLIFYAQSWLLTHYLIRRDWQEGTHRVTDFAALLAQSVKPEEAGRRTIGDPMRLQEELKQYLHRHRYIIPARPMPPSLDVNDFTAEPASPAESLAVRAEFMAVDGHYAEAQKMAEEALQFDPKLAAAHESMTFILAAKLSAAMAKTPVGQRDAVRLAMTPEQQEHEKNKTAEVPSPIASPAATLVAPSGPPPGSGSKGEEAAALSETTEVPSQTAPPAAGPVAPGDEPFFEAYRASEPITKWPLKKLRHQIPELKGLQPATDQSQLSEILRRVSSNLQKFVVNFVDTTALETLKQTETLPPSQGFEFTGGETPSPIAVEVRNVHHTTEKSRYLMLARREGSAFTLVEYRTDLQGQEEHPQERTKEFIKTTGFTAMLLFFGPLQQPWSDFRLLGQQRIGGDRTEAVAFAEHIDPAAVMGRFSIGRTSVPLLVQGVAWIRSSDYQIVQMRTDLLASLGPLKRVTTLVHYARTQFQDSPTAFWLPLEVEVTVELDKNIYTNRHKYSDYQLFRAKSVIKSDTGMTLQH